jgi:hypothetical protein
MDVWGDDPWAEDNATSTGIRRNDAAQTSNSVLGGFEDEAGWGDFEASADNAWGNEELSREAGSVKEEEMVDLEATITSAAHEEEEEEEVGIVKMERIESPESPKSTFEHAEPAVQEGAGEADLGTEEPSPNNEGTESARAVAENSENNAESLQEVIIHIPASDHEELSFHDGTVAISTQAGATVLRDAVATESAREQHMLEGRGTSSDKDREIHDKSTRPLSSSSEATDTSETRTISSARTSFDQGLPDALNHETDGEKEDTEGSSAHPDVVASGVCGATEEGSLAVATTSTSLKAKARPGPDFETDLKLLNKLFKPFKPRKKTRRSEQSIEDLIESTATRKTWYRVTRPQTLRGFMSGEVDDSYVRVAWPSSQIRTDAIKIVSHWASEDRIHGKTVLGGTSKASFGWDEPSTSVTAKRRSVSNIRPPPNSLHLRQLSLLAKDATLPPSPVASFGWSTSPSASAFAGKAIESATPSPTTSNAENPWRRSVPSRPSSLQISSASIDAIFAGNTEGSEGPQIPHAPPATSSTTLSAAETCLSINTSIASHEARAPAADHEDDDDEWGEMVQSPPPPDSPATASPKLLTATSAVPVEQSMLAAPKTRRPPPIFPVPSKQAVPDGRLSPARRAAFNAARVTRSLSSQHPGEDASPQDDAGQIEDFTEIQPRRVSSTAALEEGIPHVVTPPAAAQIPLQQPKVKETPKTEVLDDDWSLFESIQNNRSDEQPTGNSRDSQIIDKATPALTRNDALKVQNFLAQLPDLSYMFK